MNRYISCKIYSDKTMKICCAGFLTFLPCRICNPARVHPNIFLCGMGVAEVYAVRGWMCNADYKSAPIGCVIANHAQLENHAA